MEVLNYEYIKNQIDNFLEQRIKIEKKIENPKLIKSILISMFGINEIDNIEDFYFIELVGNINIIKYKIIDNITSKETEVTVLAKSNNLLFKLEHHKQKSKETEYSKDSYYTYESRRLVNRINIETVTNDSFKTSTVKVLNRTSLDTRAYYRKEYTFYINNNKVISVRTNDEIYLENEAGFDNILTTAIKLIDKTNFRIITHLENITLEDNVKEYKIHRKNR